MKIVYTADHSIQAALLQGLLAERGVQSWVNGSGLQGIMGGSASGVVTISVGDPDVEAAQAVIRDFEADQRTP